MLVGYGGTRNKLSVAASGSGSVDELQGKLEGPVEFGLAVAPDGKRTLFTYIDLETASSLQKAKAAVHRRSVADALQVRTPPCSRALPFACAHPRCACGC